MAAATQRVWIPPLPQGWEARYDHNQRRYFFINHVTKKTQWDDPRFQQPTAAEAASALGFGSSGRSSGLGEAYNMATTSLASSSSSSSQRDHEEESSLMSKVDMAVINKLHKEFPKANKELITDLYQLCHQNERETREQLNDMGYLKEKKSPPRQPQSQPAAAQPAAKPSLSEGQKRQMANQLKGQFPKLEVRIISMALQTCDYQLENTKRLLNAWGTRQEQSSSSTARATSGTSSSTSSYSYTPSGSLEPAPLSSSDDTTPRALESNAMSSSSPRRSAASSSQGHGGTSQAQHQHNARQVTKNQTAKSKTARKKTNVVTSQPQNASGPATANATYRTVAHGPDASLRKGPDGSLLIEDYETPQGPDRSLRNGPDRSRVAGPMGAQGPDPSLRCGPQSSFVNRFSAGQPLVTNI